MNTSQAERYHHNSASPQSESINQTARVLGKMSTFHLGENIRIDSFATKQLDDLAAQTIKEISEALASSSAKVFVWTIELRTNCKEKNGNFTILKNIITSRAVMQSSADNRLTNFLEAENITEKNACFTYIFQNRT